MIDRDIDDGVQQLADRFGIDLPSAHNNGSKILVALMHQVVRIEYSLQQHVARFSEHTAREDRLYTAISAVLGGLAIVTLPSVFPAVESTVIGLTGLPINHEPITWPTDLLQSLGGGLIVLGIIMAVRQGSAGAVLRKIFRR